MPADLPVLSDANADFVTDRLAVGGDLVPEFTRARRQLQELVDAGITHIADLREEWSDEGLVRTWAPQLRYFHHRVEDAGQTIGSEWFEDLNAWVAEALTQPGAKVLVHCHMGVNRAPSAVFGLLLAQGWNVGDALSAIREARPVAVIDYADDALDWHLARTDASPRARAGARRSLRRWREANHVDMSGVIRQIRETEGSGSIWAISLDEHSAEALATMVVENPSPTVGIAIDAEPPELAMRDEVVLTGSDGAVLGFGMVAGPPQDVPDAGLVIPVLVLEFGPAPILTANMLRAITPEGLDLSGASPVRLGEPQVRTLNLALRLLATVAETQD